MLRTAKVFAPLAGLHFPGPTLKPTDAIYQYFFKKRGKAKEAKFQSGELEIHAVMEEQEYELAVDSRDLHMGAESLDNQVGFSGKSSAIATTKVGSTKRLRSQLVCYSFTM
jgi:hypothetical protein